MQIDLNCDVGEGIGNEKMLLPLVSSCNIACGAHAGNISIMEEVVDIAIKNKVAIGAHPGYPDKENFGRISMSLSSEEFIKSIRDQIALLQTIVLRKGEKLYHIKPHGALYNNIAKDKALAKLFLESITSFNQELFVPPQSQIALLAREEKKKIKYEVFADRNYTEDYTLVSRDKKNAIIHNKEKVVQHVFGMVKNNRLTTVTGKQLHIFAETICVHGDNEKALEILQFLRSKLMQEGIEITHG